jgi:hypothetical protein
VKRGGQLARSPMARRKSSLRSSTVRERTAPRRDTGPDRAARALVYEREGLRCAACGISLASPGAWRSVQHRLARGQGGGNELWNLILLCGSATSPGCHRKCEDRGGHMNAQGFWLWSWQDPRTEPVMLHGDGGGITVWLDGTGGYSTEPPGES